MTGAAREAGAAWRGWPRVGPFGDAAVLVDLLRAPGPETTALVHDLGGLRPGLEVGVHALTLDDESFAGAFGVSRDGAVLVRPDGYVAWRAAKLPDDAPRALGGALQAVLSASA